MNVKAAIAGPYLVAAHTVFGRCNSCLALMDEAIVRAAQASNHVSDVKRELDNA